MPSYRRARWVQAFSVSLPTGHLPTPLPTCPFSTFQGLLGRDPDAQGLKAWTAELDNGLTPSKLLSGIAASNEYVSPKAHGSLNSAVPSSTDGADSGWVSEPIRSVDAPVQTVMIPDVIGVDYVPSSGVGWVDYTVDFGVAFGDDTGAGADFEGNCNC